MNMPAMKSFSHTALTLLLGAFVALGLSACAEGTEDGLDADTTDTAMAPPPGAEDGMQDGAMQDGGTMGDSVTVQGTINMLRQGVTTMPVNAAVRNINGWQSRIEDRSELSDLNDNLDALKEELQADQIDDQAVGDLLTQLGDQTNQAAQNAPAQQMPRLQTLGQTLTQAGNQLTGGGAPGATNGGM